ncbi:snurportin-1-like isoform X2 [Dendronephthya gigantea]|uniref:snurportin-1-like isoform X2 n=1 Tax=Dendronephthya gigantea TaxID=151771 RepID=UPI0010699FBA|nr:snurportin-1-like isoform X2 [Dendronephthya gigantea]
MEELSESLAASFQISNNPNDTSSPHPRLSEYKIKPSNVPDQETRRRRILEEQKSRRSDRVNYARRLVEEEDDMEVEDAQTKKKSTNLKRAKNPFKNQLMMSEWLVDLPENFDNEWTMVISPIGKRCLIVASRGRTTCYTKSGYSLNRFQSLLPGGCRDSGKPSDYTLLDCVYSELHRTFFILDVMCWRGHPVYDSETEFRFYWSNTKLGEQPELAKESKQNPYKFVAAETCSCDRQSIFDALASERHYQIDGILFYHKQAHYHPGNTPLVGWLKVYMIPEILGMEVPGKYLQNVPKVHKLTLIKENEKFREKGTKGDEMDVDKSGKKRGKRKNTKSKEMVVDEDDPKVGKSVEEME